MMIILINSIPAVVLSDCPLLRSFINDTGVLDFNKTTMMNTESIIHCQWLVVGSSHQRIVVEFDYIFIPISVEEYLKTGCRRGSVNLWTPGLRHEKVELCGDRRKVRVAGVGQTLMIEFRLNDYYLDANFFMHYQLIQIEQALSTPSHLINSSILSAENYAECGLTSTNGYKFSRGVTSRIVGGRQAVPHSHPWQVLLNDRGKFCGATVLNANWIITAAHCVNGTNPENLLAEFGIHDRYSVEHSRVKRTIKQIVVYPSYNGKLTRWVHDIALLQLSNSLIFNPFVRSICLSSISNFIQIGDRTLVTGWGDTHGTGNFRYLREVEVPIQSNDQCRLKDVNSITTLCAGLCQNSTCDACQGDSGGPMVLLRNGRWHLVGLISWGFSCAGLGVYTKISYYTDWITKIIYH
ncbi:unnamed protein product [Rotaria sordida]|uniref:Peptidase S1 domain-containing protein n=1 Tax=Rotaria sordida TaxID=392033 RepID=A0A813W835_9BILA|nr:unnamed protein product [Rotaria sordida]CAF1234118.1 unnamed protein product [Rotaria sordida]